ncbi:MAG: hypothetical protein M1530_02515 [Candidatus Marsarchaeota archaeon]|nr:hypothetical protein [Candidatus Marsarchaeota archaeon]
MSRASWVMMMKKAQAGLDFLMTYSWALLLIVLIIGVLFAMGIFDVGSFLGSRSAGFGQVRPVAWRIDTDGNLTLKLQNNAGTGVNVTNITATLGLVNVSSNASFLLPVGRQSGSLLIGNLTNSSAPGSSYSLQLFIRYIDSSTNFTYTDAGTLTGRIG